MWNQLVIIAKEESEAPPEDANLTAANNGRMIESETPASGSESAIHGSPGAAATSKPA